MSHMLVNCGKGFLFHAKSVLGSGGYGTVFRAQRVEGGDEVALKQIKKTSKRSDDDLKEVEIMEQLEHPNVVKFLDVYEDPVGLYIAMELVPHGTLEALLLRRGIINEAETKYFVRGTLSALSYLADNKVVHGDLKPQNILLGEHLKPIISDFGFSVSVSDHSVVLARGGTIMFMSPETMRDGKCGLSADMWSLGAIAFRCLQGGTPGRPHGEPQRQQPEILRQLLQNSVKLPPVTPSGRSLYKKMLHVKPQHRITAAEAYNDAYFTEEHTPTTLPLSCLRRPLLVESPAEKSGESEGLELVVYVLKNVKNLGPERHDAWILLNKALEVHCKHVSNLQLRHVSKTRNGTKTILFAARVRFDVLLPLMFTCCDQENLIIEKHDPTRKSSRSTSSNKQSPKARQAALPQDNRDNMAIGLRQISQQAEPRQEAETARQDRSECSKCGEAANRETLLTCVSCRKDKLCAQCAFNEHGDDDHVVEEWVVVEERRKIREDGQQMQQAIEFEMNAKKEIFAKLLDEAEESKKKVEKLAKTETAKMPLLMLREGRKRMLVTANSELQKSKAMRSELKKHLNSTD